MFEVLIDNFTNNFISHFEGARRLYLTLHVFSVVLGMGAALVSDYLFTFFVRDFKINKFEHSTFRRMSKLVWASLYAITLSGIAVFLSDISKYAHSDKFLTKMTVVFVIVINGYLMKRLLEPVLHKLKFDADFTFHKITLRKKAFVLGAISGASWLSAFVLAMLKNLPYTYFKMLSVYGLVVLGAIIMAQVVEKTISREAQKEKLSR
jgi:hypothetical protein